MIFRFQTYFPHIDNVYSHRSTQKYKRKAFVSHYWDCRLKGRPPGTPKSNDPNKKKRKRIARERDLCDVKIKITEYFPGAATSINPSDFGTGVESLSTEMGIDNTFYNGSIENPASAPGTEVQQFGILTPSQNLPLDHPGASGARYYTIQRVNGNAGGPENAPVAVNSSGGHKHSLEESDRVKKNTVQRWLIKRAKERKKNQVSTIMETSFPSRSCRYFLRHIALPEYGLLQRKSLLPWSKLVLVMLLDAQLCSLLFPPRSRPRPTASLRQLPLLASSFAGQELLGFSLEARL